MTHEIMNSVAPISSLADTLLTLIGKDAPPGEKETWDDIKTCIRTIQHRSDGLLKFTETYRNLNRVRTIECRETPVRILFENIQNLLMPTLEQKNIIFEVVLKEHQMSVNMDIHLVEQALINMILNAIDAVKSSARPLITMSGYFDEKNKAIIKITDNGHGIEKDILDKIFVPFFTTKKNGNGVGLSLCRQIMVLHKGNIHVQSEIPYGTEIALHF